MHTSISGLGDYPAEDDRDALRIARDIMANLEWDRPGRGEISYRPPRHDPEELLGIMPMDHKRPVYMRHAIARIVDDSDFTESAPTYRPPPLPPPPHLTPLLPTLLPNTPPP